MTSALDITKYFQSSFLTSLHCYPFHQAPKIMSIVDFDRIQSSFLAAWEALFKELAMLPKNRDQEIAVKLGRARSEAFAFQLAHDIGTKEKPCVDMYNFIEKLKSQ